MEIAAHKKKNALVVSAKGRIDAVTTPQFEKSLFDFISKGEKIFVINSIFEIFESEETVLRCI